MPYTGAAGIQSEAQDFFLSHRCFSVHKLQQKEEEKDSKIDYAFAGYQIHSTASDRPKEIH